MLARERQNKIVEMVNENGSVLVRELAEMFDVTEDSIRKDLTLLEKKGFLKKTYGGAMKQHRTTNTLYLSQRKEENIREKQEIAKRALKLIREGDVVFLDVSTINIELIKLIMETNLKISVVTNMIDVMMLFTPQTNKKLVFIGGRLNRGKDGFTGSYANKQIAEFHFDKAFMGVVGIDAENNQVYTHTTEGALTKKTIMCSSSQSYMLVENEKFYKKGSYKFAKIDDFTGLILEKQPSDDISEKIAEYPVELIY